MAERRFILDVAKLVIAAAWADGALTNEEVNALKDLLFQIPDVSGEEWLVLELYMASPVSREERERLARDVAGSIRSKEDKQLVVATMTQLIEADGAVDRDEQEALEAVKQDVESAPTGLLAHLGQGLRAAMKRRTGRAAAGPNREERLDDFIKNRVYYQLVNELNQTGQSLKLPDEEVRKICLGAGLMAHVSWIDSGFSAREEQAMTRALVQDWKLSEETARLVVGISRSNLMKGLDVVRLTRNFFELTDFEERRAFVRCLFDLANACGKTSFDEINAIRTVAKGLKLSHQEFIDAKLTIPRPDRGGL